MPATHTANGGDNGEWGRSRQPRQSEGFNDYNFQEFRDDKHVKHNCAIEKKRSHTQYILYCIAYSLLHTYVLFFEKNVWKFSERPDKKTDDPKRCRYRKIWFRGTNGGTYAQDR